MKRKYYVPPLRNRTQIKGQRPWSWCTGPDAIKHEKYYAWLKHRSQAQYRGEAHDLTFEEWESIWTDELFLQRGRHTDAKCLVMIDNTIGWCLSNVEIISRGLAISRSVKGRVRGV